MRRIAVAGSIGHTIELYDYGVTDDGSFFFVMELLEGLDLAQLVREHGPQPAARVISILAQACASLAEAHDAGLLHRDIKPANLFLSRAADEVDIVKLLDFGIAHNVAEPVVETPITVATVKPVSTGERLTVEGSVIGTLASDISSSPLFLISERSSSPVLPSELIVTSLFRLEPNWPGVFSRWPGNASLMA